MQCGGRACYHAPPGPIPRLTPRSVLRQRMVLRRGRTGEVYAATPVPSTDKACVYDATTCAVLTRRMRLRSGA
eukprot:2676253-Rhodomonas_salina.1